MCVLCGVVVVKFTMNIISCHSSGVYSRYGAYVKHHLRMLFSPTCIILSIFCASPCGGVCIASVDGVSWCVGMMVCWCDGVGMIAMVR